MRERVFIRLTIVTGALLVAVSVAAARGTATGRRQRARVDLAQPPGANHRVALIGVEDRPESQITGWHTSSLGREATLTNIRDTLGMQLWRRAGKAAIVIIYFSGHGVPEAGPYSPEGGGVANRYRGPAIEDA